VHNVSDVRQIDVCTAEPLVPGPSCLEVAVAIAKLKKYESPGSDQILALAAADETLVFLIHKLISTIWNKKELPDQWKEPIILPIHRKGSETYYNNYHGISML
jgi:hypothetical protein